MHVRIIGGRSSTGRVSISSDEFIATARYYGDNNIACQIRRHSPISRFLYKNGHFPVLRLARIIIFFIDSMTKKSWALLGIYVVIMVILGQVLPDDSPASGMPAGASSSSPFGRYWFIYAAIIIGMLFYTRRNISSWHGAEHMAIASYKRTGLTDICCIANEDPVHSKCGVRLFLPIIMGMISSHFVANSLRVSELIISLVFLEVVLWVDELIGWDKIPGTAQISHFLQKWITTRKPGERELRTAQLALQELVAAHKSL